MLALPEGSWAVSELLSCPIKWQLMKKVDIYQEWNENGHVASKIFCSAIKHEVVSVASKIFCSATKHEVVSVAIHSS